MSISDLQTDRPFGVTGAILFFLIAASCFLSIKSWFEVPMNRALAYQAEKQIDFSTFPGGKAGFDAGMDKTIRETNVHVNIDAVGTVLWCAGFLAGWIRSLWSPRCFLAGLPFKIAGNLYVKNFDLLWFDLVILILTVVIWIRWREKGLSQ